MARPPRLEASGTVYHVMARGNERRAVFRDDADRERYLSRLAHYREKFGFKLLAYCLMDNHVHLAIESGDEPLSRIMAGLQSSYTQGFNRRHRRVGHLFQGRYKAYVVDKDAYLLGLVRYIHENPRKAKLVERTWEYPWSSDRHYRFGRGPSWLDQDLVLSKLGRGRREAIRRYRALMGKEPEELYEQVKAVGQVVIGDEGFARGLFRKAADPEQVLRWLTEERVASETAEALGLKLIDLKGTGRRRDLSRGRAMAALIGRRLGKISFERMGRYLGRDGSTLVRDVGYLERELKSSAKLRRQAATIAATLRAIK
jgi:REP element-mobilizing transposase RayT